MDEQYKVLIITKNTREQCFLNWVLTHYWDTTLLLVGYKTDKENVVTPLKTESAKGHTKRNTPPTQWP